MSVCRELQFNAALFAETPGPRKKYEALSHGAFHTCREISSTHLLPVLPLLLAPDWSENIDFDKEPISQKV